MAYATGCQMPTEASTVWTSCLTTASAASLLAKHKHRDMAGASSAVCMRAPLQCLVSADTYLLFSFYLRCFPCNCKFDFKLLEIHIQINVFWPCLDICFTSCLFLTFFITKSFMPCELTGNFNLPVLC